MDKLIKDFEHAQNMFQQQFEKIGNFRISLSYNHIVDYELEMKLPTMENVREYNYQDISVDILAAKALIDLREYCCEILGGF